MAAAITDPTDILAVIVILVRLAITATDQAVAFRALINAHRVQLAVVLVGAIYHLRILAVPKIVII